MVLSEKTFFLVGNRLNEINIYKLNFLICTSFLSYHTDLSSDHLCYMNMSLIPFMSMPRCTRIVVSASELSVPPESSFKKILLQKTAIGQNI